MSPKVSIIIPVYNTKPYLRECLDSAMNQTLREIEIICINDGSTDGSSEILDEYTQKDSRFVVIHQKNAGVSAARNRGLNLAHGEFIAFLDSDDLYELTLCEETYQKALETNADVVAFLMKRPNSRAQYDTNEIQTIDGVVDKLNLCFEGGPSCCSKLWKSEFLRKNNIHFPNGISFSEDMFFCLQAVFATSTFAILNQYLYTYRKRANSLTTNQDTKYAIQQVNVTLVAISYIPTTFSEKDAEIIKIYLYSYLLHIIFFFNEKWNGKDIELFYQKIVQKFPKNFWLLLRQNKLEVRPTIKNRLCMMNGTFYQRLTAYFKYRKYVFIDYFVKKLIPHSDWLQWLLEEHDRLMIPNNKPTKIFRHKKENIFKR
ncbi:MAG: glycosyltransferase family 2 protein [Planctomycetia bacterium]|nr:glycosyltransferase family 2 protein [Planctomycetia bacterium]